MRAAFEATMKDAQFRADAEKIHLWIDPLNWGDMHKLLDTAYNAPPATIERAKILMKKAIEGK